MASEVIMTLSKDAAERARLISEFKYEVDTRTHINFAKREKTKEIAQKMKAIGLTLEQIKEITGLSEEQIEEL